MRSFRRQVIRVRISGGIGNQLFMYIAGLALSQRLGVTLEVYRKVNDKAEYLHPGDLSEFQIPLLKEIEGIEFKADRILSRLQRFSTRRFYNFSKLLIKYFEYFETSEIGYDSRLDLLSPGVEIRGYFQTYRYFDYCLRHFGVSDLISLHTPSESFQSYSQNFETSKICAIHVRRGDLQLHQESIGLMGLAYYDQAIEKVLENRIVERFAVFSDDPEEAHNLLGSILPTNTIWPEDFETLSAAENLILMSCADSLIIANSSFSLFAAMLSREKSLIIRPSRWFKGQEDPIDLFRPHWIEVAV